MKIVSLEAENYKRLKAVRIEPDGNLVVVTGKNAQGKSSVLDAIFAALAGKNGNKATKPIRDGEDRAKVTLDLGDLIVTRKWSGDTSTVTVESKEGARFQSPQDMLNRLLSSVSFDPLAFTRLPAKEQRDMLLGMVDVGIDLDENARARAETFERRTELGREAKAIGDVTVDESLPSDEADPLELLSELAQARGTNDKIAAARRDHSDIERSISDRLDRMEALKAELKSLERDRKSAAKAAQQEPVDTADLEKRYANLGAANAAIRANNTARDSAARKAKLEANYHALTDALAKIDAEKSDALAAAKMPVDGLGFDDDGVTFNGIPFGQASAAEQIRVSLAVAIASNPKLRVARIMDGSLLDDDNMATLADAATEHDMQVWVERVGTDAKLGVVIEDGEVKGGGD